MGEIMRKRFTLLEMVVAMLIVGVLLSLSLTGLEKLATAEAMKTAATRLENAVLKARTKAIIEGRENNVYVALLLPDSNDYINAGGLPCRSYRLCKVTKNTSNQYQFSEWIRNEDWQTLGTGIIIAGVSNAQRENPSNSSASFADKNYRLDNSGSGNGKKLDVADRFQPSSFRDYTSMEDFGDSSVTTNIDLIQDVPNGFSGSTPDCPGIVFNKYGNIVNAVDLCLVLAEGNVLDVGSTSSADNSYRFRNVFTEDGDLYLGNWVEITFNIFTGRPNIRMMGEDKP